MDNCLAIGEFAVIELLNHHLANVKKVTVKSEKEKTKYQKYQIPVVVNLSLFNKTIKKEDIYAYAEFTPYLMKLNPNTTHLLFTDLNDEGEIGTILRTAVAFDYFDVALINCSIDLFSPKLIRASTGAIFMMNVEKFNSLSEYQKKYKNKNILFKNNGTPLSLEVGAKLYQLKI
ncbi:MAG: hypothetical protein MJ208_04140 [Bacilli bacterium]|nr:hypothetical protein [Bacilli bacterium]